MSHLPSLAQQVASLFILGFDGATLTADNLIYQDIAEYGLGGVILFEKDLPRGLPDKNILNPTQLKTLCHDLQSIREELLLIGIDQEGGTVARLNPSRGFDTFLSAQALSLMPLEEATNQFEQLAQLLKNTGINCNFAPCVDLNLNPDNPIIGAKQRSFGDGVETVTAFAKAFDVAMHKRQIMTSYKHFPGHGSAAGDSHLGFVDVTDCWQGEELEVFAALIKNRASCAHIMVGHLVNRQLDSSGLPATLSTTMLHDILRKQLGFDGLLISDDMQMQAITDNFTHEEALLKGLQAGIDLFIYGNQCSATPVTLASLIELVMHFIEKGDIAASRITESYQRVMSAKNDLAGAYVSQ